jgi:hypothetical protein
MMSSDEGWLRDLQKEGEHADVLAGDPVVYHGLTEDG